jgi:hypothetical protein
VRRFQDVSRLENRFFVAGKPGSHALTVFPDWIVKICLGTFSPSVPVSAGTVDLSVQENRA